MDTNLAPARLQPTGSKDRSSRLARSDSSTVLSRRASQAEQGQVLGTHRRASQAQIAARTDSHGGMLEAVGAALDPSYTDVDGMRELLEKASAADLAGNISVQILEAKYDESKGGPSKGPSDSPEEEELSLQDKIDDALDPSFDDHVVMRTLLDEADATYFQHAMVNILRAKCEEAEAQIGPLRAVMTSFIESGDDTEETEEDEEDEEGDEFNMDAALPAFAAPPRPPATASPNGRRGSIVQFGGRRMSMSVGAELNATAARLRQATATGDATQMQAALDAAAPAAMMDGPGAAEVKQLAMEIATRLATDENLRRSVNLRHSQNVRSKVRRLWDLMVVESAAIVLEGEPGALFPSFFLHFPFIWIHFSFIFPSFSLHLDSFPLHFLFISPSFGFIFVEIGRRDRRWLHARQRPDGWRRRLPERAVSIAARCRRWDGHTACAHAVRGCRAGG